MHPPPKRNIYICIIPSLHFFTATVMNNNAPVCQCLPFFFPLKSCSVQLLIPRRQKSLNQLVKQRPGRPSESLILSGQCKCLMRDACVFFMGSNCVCVCVPWEAPGKRPITRAAVLELFAAALVRNEDFAAIKQVNMFDGCTQRKKRAMLQKKKEETPPRNTADGSVFFSVSVNAEESESVAWGRHHFILICYQAQYIVCGAPTLSAPSSPERGSGIWDGLNDSHAAVCTDGALTEHSAGSGQEINGTPLCSIRKWCGSRALYPKLLLIPAYFRTAEKYLLKDTCISIYTHIYIYRYIGISKYTYRHIYILDILAYIYIHTYIDILAYIHTHIDLIIYLYIYISLILEIRDNSCPPLKCNAWLKNYIYKLIEIDFKSSTWMT